MKIPLLRGRAFSEIDATAAPLAAVVNQAFVERFWPGQNPLGKRIHMGPASVAAPWREVVGVVGNVSHVSLAAPAAAEIFFPMAQQPQRAMAVVVSATPPTDDLIVPSVRTALAAVDGMLPIYGVTSTAQLVDNSLAQPRFSTALVGLFSVLALALAVVGVYGVTAYIVTQRTKEMGIRIALGARTADILRSVLGQGFRWTAGAFWLSHFLANQLFGIKPGDPLTFVAAAAVLGVAALAACYLPARRATRADPMAALRHE